MSRWAITAERMWDGTADRAVESQAVVIDGAAIVAVIPKAELPPGIPVRAFPGATLLPGLIDAHVHYSAAMGPAFLAAGVTTIRDVGNDLDWILEQRARHAAEPACGPTIVCCGHLLDGPQAIWKHMGRPHRDAEALRASVREEVARGVDAIKFYAGLDLDMLAAGVAEARAQRHWSLAHLGAVTAEDAARVGLNEIQHLTGCAPAWKASTVDEQDALIDVLLEHQVVMTPTLVVWDRLGGLGDLAFFHDERRAWVHPCHRAIWDRYRVAQADRHCYQSAMAHVKSCLARMQARGLTLALGTDAPFPHLIPGFSVHDELAMYVDAGIAPVAALRSATSIGARVLGVAAARAGRLVPGMQADLLVVAGNPLEDIRDIRHVACTVRAGRVFERQELAGKMAQAARHDADGAVTSDLCRYTGAKPVHD